MATGDTNDFVRRISAVLPRWFPDATKAPIVYGLVTGLATVMEQCYALLQYVRLQTRLLTATDGWLDLASYDFFGNGLPRKSGENDTGFRSRILASLFLEKATRKGMSSALEMLTGTAPVIFEPARPADAFCLGYSGLGVGRLGSYQMNNQAFVTVFLPVGQGGANIAGLGSSYAGLGSGYMAMADATALHGPIAPSDVYQTIENVKPLASTVWVKVSG